MIFRDTPLPGVFLVELEPKPDDRGFFARAWCADEFARTGLSPALAQVSVSYNHKAGTLRGMHYQAAPHGECKLVRCTAGSIYDVALDLRPDSPTYLKWHAAELSAANRHALYLPEGIAHGFLTLSDGAEVLYQISIPQVAEAARGLRWNDPVFGIRWPRAVSVISARDRDYADFQA